MKRRLLIVTNLHPVPWAPNRASFNAQQFSRLAERFELATIVLVPWIEWLKHRSQCNNTALHKYVPYFYFPKIGRALYPLFQRWALSMQRSWVRNFQPDAILASWGYPDAVATQSAFSDLKVPCFIKVHGTDINENMLHPQRKQQIVESMHAAAAVFCPSQELGRVLIEHGVASEKVNTVYNGVDKSVFYPGDKAPSNITFVGNMLKTKGLNELYAAFKLILVQQPDLRLVMVGDGPLKLGLQQQAEADNITTSIEFCGSLPLADVAAKVRAASVLVLPSYREGLPNVLLEALASATPVVASDVGGIPELVTADVGFIINDISPDNLALTLTKALASDWSSATLLHHVAQFDWDLNADRVASIINQHCEKTN